MRWRRVAGLLLTLALGSCASHTHGIALPGTAATTPGGVATPGGEATPTAPPQRRIAPPPAPAAMMQHPPLWFVRGAVVDARSGRPLDNAAIVVLSRRDSLSIAAQRSIVTGADGRFTLDLPAPGEYHIKVAALGYRFRTESWHVAGAGQVPYRVFRLSLLAVASRTSTTPPANAVDPHGP